MNKTTLFFAFCTLIMLAESCANIGRPSGGKQDTTPPKLIQSAPENGSTNFKGNKVVIEFDEFIQLNNLSQQLIISPVMAVNPEITASRNKIVMLFKQDLQPNTTYTINFGNAIADVHESNQFQQFSFVFSTGNAIDTLKSAFNIVDAYEKTPLKNAIVALYKNDSLSFIKKNKPLFVSKTNENGDAFFNNLNDETYTAIAFLDDNSNLIPDVKTEAISLLAKNIKPSTIAKAQPLLLSKSGSISLLKSINFSKPNFITIEHNKLPKSATWSLFDKEKLLFWEEKISSSKTNFWLLKNNIKSVKILLQSDEKILDSAKVNYIGRGSFKNTGLTAEKAYQNFMLNKSGKALSIILSQPISSLEKDKITLSNEEKKEMKFDVSKDEEIVSQLNFFVDDIQTKNIFVSMKKDALEMLDKSRNTDSLRAQVPILKPDELSKITIQLDSISPNYQYIIQLKNKAKEVVEEKNIRDVNSSIVVFERLYPDEYTLYIIEDENMDGIWNSSDIELSKSPEKIKLLSKIIARANWETEKKVVWDLR